ncbi:hypothetical protein DPMN_189035 [Dreissena polymorpha]|uniref:Uncharacterized protein n=1 Tax=Dreissena polymorpha TaxID=45954 RepID=A0A9D4DSS2_DREPO|nr:hypothetical protein DPMN_189035 [Dreissena polymorpha]
MLKLAQTDQQTDQQTGQKQYVPHYYMKRMYSVEGVGVARGMVWVESMVVCQYSLRKKQVKGLSFSITKEGGVE